MKPVFKCDYCQFMGTEEEVSKHEPRCFNNYDRRSCYTCEHRGELNVVRGLMNYKCKKCVPIANGTILEFCEYYERAPKPDYKLFEATYGNIFDKF